MSKFYITTPIYYVTAEPHIGHAYTTVSADALARYHRLIGDETWFLAGTDEHGAKVAQTAKKQGIEPQVFADNVVVHYTQAWKKLNVTYDDFIRTTEDRHTQPSEQYLETLKKKGWLYPARYEGLYCVDCEAYVKEGDLEDGKCPDHKKAPEKLAEDNWFFKLSAFQHKIREKIESGELLVKPKTRENEVLGFLNQGLEDIAISRRHVDWGITLPFDPEQTIYVWIEALFNYLTALGYPEGEKYKRYWPPNVQLLGKDILKFHAVIWPALLMALEIPLPKELFIHGFFTVDGLKMSKTIGNVLDPVKLVDQYGADATRYFLLSEVPFGQDGDVSASRFGERYRSDLANNLGNLTTRTLSMVERYQHGRVPKPVPDSHFDMAKFWLDYEKRMHDLDCYHALGLIQKYLIKANQYIDKQQPWVLARENDDNKLDEVLYNLSELLRHISIATVPFMPRYSRKTRELLGLSNIEVGEFDFAEETRWGGLKRGTIVKKGEGLFPRLD